MATTPLDANTGAVIRVQDTAAYTGDPDWALDQGYAAAEAAGVVSFPTNRGVSAVAVTIEAYDVDGQPVAGDRGSFTLTPVRLLRGVVHDGESTVTTAWSRTIVGDSAGSPANHGVRISAPTIPAGAVELRVYVEALRGV